MDDALVLPSLWLPVLAGTVTPLLVGLATRLRAASGLKAFVALVLVTAAALVEQLVLDGGVVHADRLGALWVATFGSHVISYYGLWKPVGGGTSPAQRATPHVGIGGPPPGP